MQCRFVLGHDLVASVVIGAMTEAQLRELHAAAEEGPLAAHVLVQIDDIHQQYPNPCP